MKIYFKEYGWMTVPFWTWLRAQWACRTWFDWQHDWRRIELKEYGWDCYCGSDNCSVCIGCGYQTHD